AIPRRSRGHAPTGRYLRCPYCQKSIRTTSFPRSINYIPQDDGQLEPAVERHRYAEQRGVRLPRRRVGRELRVRMHIVRDDEGARLELPSGEGEQGLVVALLRVEEADVEDV